MDPNTTGVAAQRFDLLNGLPAGTTVHSFENIMGYFNKTRAHKNALFHDKTNNEYLVFTDAPANEFQRFKDSESQAVKHARWLYFWSTGILIMKFGNGMHDYSCALTTFPGFVYVNIRDMDFQREVRIRPTIVHYGDISKRFDACWSPLNDLSQRTLVMEMGLSESKPQLDLQAIHWLIAAESPVQVVFTMELNREKEEIVLRKWERPDTGSFRRSLRNTSSPEQLVTGEVTISHENKVGVASSAMELPFSKIVGRDPDPNKPHERDFLIPKADLGILAEHVWMG